MSCSGWARFLAVFTRSDNALTLSVCCVALLAAVSGTATPTHEMDIATLRSTAATTAANAAHAQSVATAASNLLQVCIASDASGVGTG